MNMTQYFYPYLFGNILITLKRLKADNFLISFCVKLIRYVQDLLIQVIMIILSHRCRKLLLSGLFFGLWYLCITYWLK